MAERRPCIICYRLTSDAVDLQQPLQQDKQQALVRFFQFLGRHLHDSYKTDGQVGSGFEPTQFPIEKVIHAGLLTCTDCSLIIESFCELYHQMKSTELLLNWKVNTLKNTMLCAQRVPARVSEFRICVEKLDIGDISADEVFYFKKELGKKCDGILQTSLPILKLCKYKTENYAAKSVAQTNPKQLVDDTERSHSPCSPFSECDEVDTEEVDNMESDPLNMDLDGLHVDDFLIKSTMNDPLISSTEIVQVKEDQSHLITITENPSSPQTIYNPDQIPIRSIRNGDFDDNLRSYTPTGTAEPISESSNEYLVPLPPIIIPSKDSNTHQKLEIEKDAGTGMYLCRICLSEFKSSQSAGIHFESINHLNIRFKCSINVCREIFHLRRSYYRHFREKHMNNTTVKCDVCQRIFTAPSSLRRHHMYAYAKGGFQCKFCLKSFAHERNLRVHIKRHCPNNISTKANHAGTIISPPSAANPPRQMISDAFYKTVAVTTGPVSHLQRRKKICEFCHANFVHRTTLSTHKLICPKKPSTAMD